LAEGKNEDIPEWHGFLDPWKAALPHRVIVSDMGDAFANSSSKHLKWLEASQKIVDAK